MHALGHGQNRVKLHRASCKVTADMFCVCVSFCIANCKFPDYIVLRDMKQSFCVALFYFPTCHVKVARFYVSCPAPPSPSRMLDRMSDRLSEHMSDRMPEHMSDRMPEHMSDRMPEHMSERMPDRMPERMPTRMPK